MIHHPAPTAAACFAALALAAAASANHIDFISDGAFTASTSSDSGPLTVSQLGDAGNILGSEREVTLSTDGTVGIVSAGTAGAPAGAGPVGPDTSSFLLLDDSVTTQGSFVLTYDGVGSAGLGGLDFDTQWDQIVVSVPAIIGAADLDVEVEDTAGNVGRSRILIALPGDYGYAFTNPDYAGVDFTSVDRVSVIVDSIRPASDFAISQITREVIPEPTGLGLLAAAGLGLVRRR